MIELPRVNWNIRAADGGYTLDFHHACPPTVPRHLIDPFRIEDAVWWGGSAGTSPWIEIEGDRDGTLRWQFGLHDTLQVRNYCTPDANTMIVEEPGPRGTTLPHRYDVFYHTGGLIYVNGVHLASDPASQPPNASDQYCSPEWIRESRALRHLTTPYDMYRVSSRDCPYKPYHS